MVGYDDEHKSWKFCSPDEPSLIRWSNSATLHQDKCWAGRHALLGAPEEVPEDESPVSATPIAERDDEAMVEELLSSVRLFRAVTVLARKMRVPSQEHYKAAQRVLRYLEGTRDAVLTYRSSENQELLEAHSDANWASDAILHRKSTSGSVAFVHGNPAAWKSATQKCLSLSAVEAEFVAATEAAREILFLKQLLRSIGLASGTPTVFSDNKGCIEESKDPAQHWKLKHIDTKFHFIRDNVQEGQVQVKYIDTKHNLADMLTKPVGKHVVQVARGGSHLEAAAETIQERALTYAQALRGGM